MIKPLYRFYRDTLILILHICENRPPFKIFLEVKPESVLKSLNLEATSTLFWSVFGHFSGSGNEQPTELSIDLEY